MKTEIDDPTDCSSVLLTWLIICETTLYRLERCQSWVDSLNEAAAEGEAARMTRLREKARLEYLDYMENW